MARKTRTVKAVETKAAETAKVVEQKAAETAKVVEQKAKEVAEETAKKAEEVKTTAKKTIAKAAAKTAVVEPRVIVQYQNREVDTAAITERIKAQFISEGHKAGCIKELNIYVKPEEYSAYYVINDKFSGHVNLF